MVHITPLRRTLPFLTNLNALVAISIGTRTVKLCSNKILQYITGDALLANRGRPA